MAQGALSGLRIIEFADFVAGPYCGKLMADLGAEVIKVEAPGTGDPARHYGPFPGDIPHPEKSLLFAYLNTNKQGITLDVRTAEGKAVLLDLLKTADVLIESHAPQEMAELGLDYASLHAAAPRLVVTSITPFGQQGPYRDYKGTHLTTMMVGGIGYATPGDVSEWETHPPLKAPAHSGDYLVGITAASGTMVAVTARELTGRGQQVDISAQQALAVQMRADVMTHTFEGQTPVRIAGMGRMVFNRRPLPCKDGYVTLQINENHFWEGLKRVMGQPEWTTMEIFQDVQSRRDNMDALMPLVGDWLMQHTRAELFQMLQVDEHLPSMPVMSIADVVDHPHTAGRGTFLEIEHPVIGTFKTPGPAMRFSEPVWNIVSAAPLLGQHNEAVLCSLLGCSKEQVVQMARAGII